MLGEYMASLIGRSPKDSFKELLTLNNPNGLGTSLFSVGDGKGGVSPLALSTTLITLNNNIWPTTAAPTNSMLRMSSISNQLEWAQIQAVDVGAVNKAGDAMTGALTLNADPASAMHAATKQYVDAVAQGLDPKASVRVATTTNISLSGTPTIDGLVVVEATRVLVKNQTTASQNGIYVVSSGAWSRSVDADNSSKVTAGMYTYVEQGNTQASTGWNLLTSNVTLGSTSLTFSQFGAAIDYTGGSNVTITGNVISVANSAMPYDIAGAIFGKPSNSAIVTRFVAVRGYRIPVSMAGSIAKTSTLASSSTVLSVQKNGSQFGTITFPASNANGTFSAASLTTFLVGDIFTITAQATADSTFGDCEFTIMASLT